MPGVGAKADSSNGSETEIWMNQMLPDLMKKEDEPLFALGHQTLSSGLQSFSQSIDSFFTHPRMDVESNGTRLRINGTSQYINKESERYNFSVNFSLDLPRTKKRLNLIFLSISEDLTQEETGEVGGASSPENSVQEQDYFAGLRLFIERNKNINISADYGVKLVMPLDPFARIRARESVFFGDWELRFTENLFWFESRGQGARLNIDFDKKIRKGLLFRQANRGSWLKQEGVVDYAHSLNLFHSLSKKAGWVYSTGLNSRSTRNPYAASYFVSARYRRSIYRNALFAEVQPFGNWSRDRNFGFQAGIEFRIQILFGPKYMRPTERPLE